MTITIAATTVAKPDAKLIEALRAAGIAIADTPANIADTLIARIKARS